MPDDDDRPLVSPRSPSYERAREELAHPSPPGDAQVIAVLGRLIEAERDAARALGAAGRPDEAAAHDGRTRSLGKMIEALGGSPPRPEESRAILAHGADEVERGGESALAAMRADLAAEYRQAAADPALSPAQRAELARLSGE